MVQTNQTKPILAIPNKVLMGVKGTLRSLSIISWQVVRTIFKSSVILNSFEFGELYITSFREPKDSM